ncbi:OmpH family outer membrane protein [candidate division WOR-3 bacterium]|nr:OmpH family outer membrane protein [candidate division WOR-3 bacterium]
MKLNSKLLFVFFALSLFAEQKIGYIDSQKILAEYNRAQEIKDEFQGKVNEWKEEVNRRQQELEKLQKNLETQTFILTEEARMRKVQEIQQKKAALESYINDVYRKDGKAELLNKELMQPLLAEIDTVVSEIAKEEEFTFILDASTGVVIYAEDMYDITSRIIETLNRKYMPGVEGQEIEYYIFNFKEEDADSKSKKLGTIIKNLIGTGMKGLGDIFEQIKFDELTAAKTSLAIKDEEEVSENVSLAVQFLSMSGVDFIVIGRVWVETGNIFFEYSIVDKEKEKAVVTEEIEVGVEENLRDRIAENVIPEIAKLYK